MFLWILHKLLQMTTVLSNMFHTLAFKVYFTGKKIWFSTMIIYDYQNDLGMNNVLLTVCICVRNEKEKWRVSSCRWREPGDILVRLCDILSFLLVTPHHWQTMIAELVTIFRVYHWSLFPPLHVWQYYQKHTTDTYQQSHSYEWIQNTFTYNKP